MQLDRYDRQILELLQQDGRISNQDLADRIGLSPSPCLRRVRTLEESGLITGYRAILSPLQLGLTHVTYVEARLSDTRQKALEQFNDGEGLLLFAEDLEMIVAIDDLYTEAAFDLLDVVIERPAQAGQTLGVRGFQVQIQGGDMTAQGILSGN